MPKKFIRFAEMRAMTGLSKGSVYNRLGNSIYGDPDFPRPIPLSPSGRGAVAWDLAEVEAWMAKKAETRR